MRANIYRVLTAAGFIVAVVLVMVIPTQMSGASPWAYYYGVKNFSQGKLVISDRLLFQEMNEARSQGGVLVQYVKIGDNQWALEKAPGYVFFLVPFELMGVPQWGNVLLAAGMVAVTYILLRRWRDEKAACYGSLLILFSSISLIMLNRAYMDTFASLAFLAMGGGLYLYHFMERDRLPPLKGSILLFLAFFFTGWSVMTRYSNLPVAIILALHFAITRAIAWGKGKKAGIPAEVLSVSLGVGLPLSALLLYNNFVFGSPLDYGYHYTPFPVKFAYEYLGQVNASGQSIPLQIILDNFRTVPQALLTGFPLLVIGVPGIIAVLYFKFFHQNNRPTGNWSSLRQELPWSVLLVLIGWFLSVYVLYMMYEFTAEYLREGSSFFRYARYYLPGLFPVAIISALVMARFPRKLAFPIIIAVIVASSVLYTQVALNPNA